MSVSSFLKKVFQTFKSSDSATANQVPPKSTDEVSTKATKKPEQQKSLSQLANNKVELKQPNEISQEKQNAVLLLIYQDEQQHEIARPQLISGLIGQKIQFKLRKLSNYNLINIKGFNDHFFSQYAIMVLLYQKQDGAPIRITFKNYDNNNSLLPAQLLKGKIGEAYQIFSPEINNFNLQTVDGKIKGFFTHQLQQVTLYYRYNEWESVEKSDISFVLLKDIFCFTRIDDSNPLLLLRAGTVWQTFKRIILYSQEIWYSLGAFWIKYQPEAMSIQKKQQPLIDNSDFLLLGKASPVNQPAKINFTDTSSVHYFDYPNGQWIGKIANQTKVSITTKIKIDDILWYELADYGWLPAHYLNF